MGFDEYVSGLIRVEDISYPTYCSLGSQDRALQLSKLAEKGYRFLNEFIPTNIQVPLLVLNEEDWKPRFKIIPYGMMTGHRGCIHFPADEAPPPIEIARPHYDNAPLSLKNKLTEIVGNGGDTYKIAMVGYRNSKVIHELTHVFLQNKAGLLRTPTSYGGLVFGVHWFNEFLCEYIQYAFLRRYEKQFGYELAISRVLPEAIYRGGLSIVKHSWSDFNRMYTDVGVFDFLWFLFRITLGAMELYSVYGEDYIGYVLDAFSASDDFLLRNLEFSHIGLGEWFRGWVDSK